MKATQQDNLCSAICHFQAGIEYLDSVAGMQDLFKQDYKRKVKIVISETESKLHQINSALSEEEKSSYYDLLKEKQAMYKLIEEFNTFEQIALFRNFVSLQSKLL